jgi:hypothetical protein
MTDTGPASHFAQGKVPTFPFAKHALRSFDQNALEIAVMVWSFGEFAHGRHQS